MNAIVPGYFKTDMTKKKLAQPKKRNNISAHSMLNRWGKIEEITGPTIFLSSNASSFYNLMLKRLSWMEVGLQKD